MPSFFRISDNKIFRAGEVDQLGFHEDEGLRIPDEYLEKGVFIIMRLAFGFGDWGIISAMPRLLKKKYPNCKVLIPSPERVKSMFIGGGLEQWSHWPTPEANPQLVFQNNPYIDGITDDLDGEIFHDAYRIWNKKEKKQPMVEQMLKFWQFTEEELKDSAPELYYSEEEKYIGDELIKRNFGESEFGGLILSNSKLKKGQFYGGDIHEKTDHLLSQYKDLPFCFYSGVNINKTPYNYINVKLDFNDYDNIPIRIQCYIRERAKVNIGYQSSIYDTIAGKTEILCTSDTMPGENGENLSRDIKYI